MGERAAVLTSEAISLRMIEHGAELARDVRATAMLISADLPLPCSTIRAALAGMPFRVIMANRGTVPHPDPAISQSTGTVTIFREGRLIASLPRATGWSQLVG